jgi:hypothetical protein
MALLRSNYPPLKFRLHMQVALLRSSYPPLKFRLHMQVA